MYVCMYVCMYICMYVYMYVCIYVYMYVCIYVCMYVCIHVFQLHIAQGKGHICMYTLSEYKIITTHVQYVQYVCKTSTDSAVHLLFCTN